MLVSLDGGQTYQAAPEGIRVMYDHVDIPGEDELGDVLLNVTHEGVIMDIWVTREGEDHNIGSDHFMITDLVARLVEENS